MKSAKILGNGKQQKSIDRLLRQAGEDRVVKEVIEGKNTGTTDISKTDLHKLKFKPCKEAEELIEGIDKDIKFYYGEGSKLASEGRLLESNILVSDNALLAIAYTALGRKDDANQIFKGIDKDIGFNDLGLVKTNTIKSAFDNSLLALAYNISVFSGGNMDLLLKADDLLRTIGANIGFMMFNDGSRLVKAGPGESDVHTIDNILLAFDYLICDEKENALRIVNGIDKHIRFKNFEDGTKLVDSGWYAGDFDGNTFENTMLSILYTVLGREIEAGQLRKGLCHAGYDPSHPDKKVLIRSSVKFEPGSNVGIRTKGFFTRDNALAAAVNLVSGNKIIADRLFKGIGNRIGFYKGSEGGKLVHQNTNEKNYIRTEDSVLLALAYMLREGCKDKNE